MKPIIIAEAGVNFNADLNIAKEMAKNAKECGADIVKYQTFWDLGCLKEYEMDKEKWIELANYCNDIGIEFMSTPHWGSPIGEFYKDEDYNVIDFVDSLVKRHKVASPYITNKKYVEYISRFGKPLIISTGSIIHPDGQATMEEVERCLRWVSSPDITLLYCISKYPSVSYDYRKIEELKRFGYPVGVSDHSLDVTFKPYPIIEKHFKINDNCIDSTVSLDPEQFKRMVSYVKSA